MEFLDLIFSVITLTILEIVLGIDNLVFLSILTEKLPRKERKRARRWGLTFAWMTRLMLLASAIWLVKLTKPVLVIGPLSLSARDIFLFLGGLFLIFKAVQEIHNEVEGPVVEEQQQQARITTSLCSVVFQIGLMDIIFSLDSVLTAIGLTQHFAVMAFSITLAIIVMVYASESVGQFIEKHPGIKMLALSFLILIGTMLIADSVGFHVPRGYLYFSMSFALGVELLNLLKRSRRKQSIK